MTLVTPPAPVLDEAAFVAAAGLGERDAALALEVARRQGVTPVRAALDLGLAGEDALADALARHLELARWSPDAAADTPIADAVPRGFMHANGVLVLDAGAGPAPHPARPLVVVVGDPSDHHTLAALLGQLGDDVAAVEVGTHKAIRAFLDAHADRDHAAEGDAGDPIDVTGEIDALRELASEAPVIRFFNQAVDRAMELNASDLHLERFDRRVSLRYRVDGVLVEQQPPPPSLYDALLCRIKIMANLDIAERRRAQDGRVQLRLRGRAVDMRVSIVPTMYGQDAAVRLQDRQKLGDIDLAALGFDPRHVERLHDVASRSHGIMLITGPTGSGKTTTLYAILRRLASAERKVITVEDPVEYAMDGVNQIQANAAVGLTFATTLRNILRHDPDVILVGEIRDQETAEMAFQSALTGHMVLSTLHTNDVPSSFVRLVDMGVEPYLVNAAVEGVSAQRLLRRLCPSCRNDPARRPSCAHCGGLGYRGRVAVMEFAAPDAALKRRMLDRADERALRDALAEAGFRTMADDARRLIAEGVTDDAEARRALGVAFTRTADGTATP